MWVDAWRASAAKLAARHPGKAVTARRIRNLCSFLGQPPPVPNPSSPPPFIRAATEGLVLEGHICELRVVLEGLRVVFKTFIASFWSSVQRWPSCITSTEKHLYVFEIL